MKAEKISQIGLYVFESVEERPFRAAYDPLRMNTGFSRGSFFPHS